MLCRCCCQCLLSANCYDCDCCYYINCRISYCNFSFYWPLFSSVETYCSSKVFLQKGALFQGGVLNISGGTRAAVANLQPLVPLVPEQLWNTKPKRGGSLPAVSWGCCNKTQTEAVLSNSTANSSVTIIFIPIISPLVDFGWMGEILLHVTFLKSSLAPKLATRSLSNWPPGSMDAVDRYCIWPVPTTFFYTSRVHLCVVV